MATFRLFWVKGANPNESQKLTFFRFWFSRIVGFLSLAIHCDAPVYK